MLSLLSVCSFIFQGYTLLIAAFASAIFIPVISTSSILICFFSFSFAISTVDSVFISPAAFTGLITLFTQSITVASNITKTAVNKATPLIFMSAIYLPLCERLLAALTLSEPDICSFFRLLNILFPYECIIKIPLNNILFLQ